MTLTLIAIGVLLFLSAFFSGSETALTGSSRPVMYQLESGGNPRAKIVNQMHENKGSLIGAILIGNNLVNILASALATSLMITLFGKNGVAYATAVMTALVVVFAEILRMTYSLQTADRTALVVAPIMRPIVFVLAPITRSILVIVRGTLRAFGLRLHTEETFVPYTEELRGAIELHEGEHEAVQHERAMLRSVLDLNEVDVGEIMAHRKSVEMVNIDDEPAKIVEQVLESPYTRVPVWQGERDNIVGVVHAKELLRALHAHPDDGEASLDILGLASEPWFIPETTRLLDQLNAFRGRREHFAIVVDEYGSLEGVVTLEDILEEIVGDIADEHDVAVPGLHPMPDGSYLVDGDFTIRDLNRELEWNLPDEEAVTVAGLVLHESRRIPEVGQKFLFHDTRFEITRRHRHQITQLKVRRQSS